MAKDKVIWLIAIRSGYYFYPDMISKYIPVKEYPLRYYPTLTKD